MMDRELPREWDLWIGLCATAAAVHAPLCIVFGLQGGWHTLFDGVLTISFAADAVLRYRGARESIPLRIADLLAAVPYLTLFGPSPLQLLRLLKLYRVAQMMRLWRLHEIRHASLLRLVFFVYWLGLLTHGVSCGWISLRGTEAAIESGSRYVRALYWTVTTLSTVGYGDIAPANDLERIYALGVMMTGVGVVGFIIGSVASLLASIDPARMSHLQRMEELAAFMNYRELPPALRERIGDYYRYAWRKGLDHDESEILERLPPSLRTEVSLHLKRELLQAVPLFRGAEQGFLRDVALEMKPVVFLPGDFVIRAGESGREMYFLSRGSVEVVSQDGATILNRLEAGEFFGEIALLFDEPRTASVRALEYCDLYRLERDLFRRVLARHPEIAAEIEQRGRERRERT